jgi:hypothetical protein
MGTDDRACGAENVAEGNDVQATTFLHDFLELVSFLMGQILILVFAYRSARRTTSGPDYEVLDHSLATGFCRRRAGATAPFKKPARGWR